MSLFAKKTETEAPEMDGLGGLNSPAPAVAAQAVKIPTPPELLTPNAQATTNAMISAAVKEAVSSAVQAIFEGLAPTLQGMALTKEKIQELKAPYKDPAMIARELRESMKSKADEDELRKEIAARQANCQHLDANGKTSICLSHNYFDRQPRGLCVLCHSLINPKEWVWGSPDPVTGKCVATIRPAHPDYKTVLMLESRQ